MPVAGLTENEHNVPESWCAQTSHAPSAVRAKLRGALPPQGVSSTVVNAPVAASTAKTAMLS